MAATTPACTTAFRFATWNVLYGRARAPVSHRLIVCARLSPSQWRGQAVGGSLHECPAEAQVAVVLQ